MPEDFLNGLNIVPLNGDHAILSSTAVSVEHPWRNLFQEREPPPDHSSRSPKACTPPLRYSDDNQLHGPAAIEENQGSSGTSKFERPRELEPHETIRLCDVEAFRNKTAQKFLASANDDQVDGISAKIAQLSTASSLISRPVIYRYIDVIKNSRAHVEAIHFELFMPDRPDLRFLEIPLESVPSGTVEGDFFRVPDADLLTNPSFAVKLGKDEFPVVWAANGYKRMDLPLVEQHDVLAYIVKKKPNNMNATSSGLAALKYGSQTRIGEVEAISEISDREISIRETLFPDADSRREHSLVRVTMRDMATAQLYPVEPPLPPPTPPPLLKAADVIKSIKALSSQDRLTLYHILTNKRTRDDAHVSRYLNVHTHDLRLLVAMRAMEKKKNMKEKEGAPKTFDAAFDSEEADVDDFDPRSEYLKRVCDVRTSSQRSGRVVSAVRELDASEVERIEDRLDAFTTYGQPGDLELMDGLFRFGSRFRVHDSRGEKDAGEIRIDESIILKTISDKGIGSLSECRRLLDCIYGNSQDDEVDTSNHLEQHTVKYVDGSRELTLNKGQSHAVRLYADEDGPRVFCILSPPGSGKTTVAAAMAAEVGRTRYERQLLLSVQNVAVDNMGAALKKLNYGGGSVYNMKSTKKLDPHNRAPFDFFDEMSEYELRRWRDDEMPMFEEVVRRPNSKKNRYTEVVRFKTKEERLTHHRREFEKGLCPRIFLSTVEMVLQKLYTSSKLCEDLSLVRRVIIDEASLMTEAALYCIIRRFPLARIVLIGDEKQLPPFMYDSNILGHELAGRPALTVAMKTGRVPVVELNEVYRAPPSLVAPYNRLAYGGRLVSKKAEGESPLSDIGLIHSGLPQLLLIDVDGREQHNEKTKSLYNVEEIDALVRLLNKLSRGSAKEIMIICLYKDQKKRIQEILDKQYKINPINQYTVLTVDSAQGKEKSIVILMTTRTEKATDFFRSIERCNVSVSRQQKALIVLGKASLLTTNKPWSTVVNGDDFTRIRAEDIK